MSQISWYPNFCCFHHLSLKIAICSPRHREARAQKLDGAGTACGQMSTLIISQVPWSPRLGAQERGLSRGGWDLSLSPDDLDLAVTCMITFNLLTMGNHYSSDVFWGDSWTWVCLKIGLTTKKCMSNRENDYHPWLACVFLVPYLKTNPINPF